MNIGLFTDTFYPIVDGVGRVVYSFANTIAQKEGHECYVIAPMADTGYRGGYRFDLIEFVSLGVPGSRQYNTGIPALDPHYDSRIGKVRLDIVHAHSPFIAGQEALRLGRKRGIPVIGTFHSKYYDDFYKLTRQEMLADIGVRFVVNFYERCDEVWTVSQSSADVLHDYGYRGDIVVIPNGTPDIDPATVDTAAVKKRFMLGDKPILLYCGQMNWKKNILRTMEACAAIKREGAQFTLVLAGQGPDANAIRDKGIELGLAEDMVLTGHVTSDLILYGLYRSATLFVFPSLYDTSGMVVREAAAMETPSVVVRGSAAAEPICDGKNGYLCDDTQESLASVLRRVLADPASAAAAGQSARETIYISWGTITDAALLRYQNLIALKKTGCLT